MDFKVIRVDIHGRSSAGVVFELHGCEHTVDVNLDINKLYKNDTDILREFHKQYDIKSMEAPDPVDSSMIGELTEVVFEETQEEIPEPIPNDPSLDFFDI